MMLFKRFVEIFGRARPGDVEMLEQTKIRFMLGESIPLAVRNVEFDIAANIWTVNYEPPRIHDEFVKNALHALREPDHAFARVPNTVRQSLADMIELMAMKGAGNA
jgi:hypothetical protein